jgi:hypothetical protein
MNIVNVDMMKRPSNWITVWIMLTLAAVFGHLILTWAGKHHALPVFGSVPADAPNGATKK